MSGSRSVVCDFCRHCNEQRDLHYFADYLLTDLYVFLDLPCPKTKATELEAFLRPGFHIIIRSLKTIADSLRQSASVSRLTCFHRVIRNRKESLEKINVNKFSFLSKSHFKSIQELKFAGEFQPFDWSVKSARLLLNNRRDPDCLR